MKIRRTLGLFMSKKYLQPETYVRNLSTNEKVVLFLITPVLVI